MFDISFMALLVISLVALIVIGPERLPIVAKTLGNLYGRCRSFVYSVRTDIHNEIRMEELKKMQSSIEETVHSVEQSVQHDLDQIKTTVSEVAPEKNQFASATETHKTSVDANSQAAEQNKRDASHG